MDSYLLQSNANALCINRYGTTLASLHSDEDFEDAREFSYNPAKDLWIGLSDRNQEGVYYWEDGTSFDYATYFGSYPWDNADNGGGLGNEDCVIISDRLNHLLNDVTCSDNWRSICNAQSELCDQRFWNVAQNDNGVVTWSGINPSLANCSLEIDGGNVMMVMHGKQWENSGDDILRVHYMFQISSNGDGDTGILLNYVDLCEYYYAGIRMDSGTYTLFIARIKDDMYKEGSNTVITLSTNTYYRLEINVTWTISVASFDICINGQNCISYDDVDPIYNNTPTYSGYIGVKNNGLNMDAKSLFVSGTEVALNDTGIEVEFAKCPTVSPTYNPTSDPTTEPTNEPTTEPTVDPSIDPTTDPTSDPTTDPTTNPTISPTADPTSDPTDNPTPDPTKEGSVGPQPEPSTVTEAAAVSSDGDDTETYIIIFVAAGVMCLLCLVIMICIYKRRRDIAERDKRTLPGIDPNIELGAVHVDNTNTTTKGNTPGLGSTNPGGTKSYKPGEGTATDAVLPAKSTSAITELVSNTSLISDVDNNDELYNEMISAPPTAGGDQEEGPMDEMYGMDDAMSVTPNGQNIQRETMGNEIEDDNEDEDADSSSDSEDDNDMYLQDINARMKTKGNINDQGP